MNIQHRHSRKSWADTLLVGCIAFIFTGLLSSVALAERRSSDEIIEFCNKLYPPPWYTSKFIGADLHGVSRETCVFVKELLNDDGVVTNINNAAKKFEATVVKADKEIEMFKPTRTY